MPGSTHSIPPSWNEADSIRETLLVCIDNPDDREALRKVGRMLYHLAVEATRWPSHESLTRIDLGAAAADLRHLEGFLAMVGRTAEESSLSVTDEALARFAGKLAARVGALAESIEEELS
jgi:hypothetical protein